MGDFIPVQHVARMASWIPYLALAVFPVSVFAPFNLVRFSWGYRFGLQTMPHDLRERAETLDRYIWPLKNLLTVAPIIILMNREGVPAASVGLRLDCWQFNTALGLSSGLFLVAIQALLRMVTTPQKEDLDHPDHTRGPKSLWGLIFLFGAFSEELWLAFCLVALRETNHSVSNSILLTAVAIGLAHFPYRFGALATACLGAASGILFLWRGSLLPPFLFHLIGNVGALYWARRGAALTRREGV